MKMASLVLLVQALVSYRHHPMEAYTLQQLPGENDWSVGMSTSHTLLYGNGKQGVDYSSASRLVNEELLLIEQTCKIGEFCVWP